MKRASHVSAGEHRPRLAEAQSILEQLGFQGRQRNELAAYTLLAMLGLPPEAAWSQARRPIVGIRGIKDFINEKYRQSYAENTRESIRDDAVKHFVEGGLLVRNPDDPRRPTNSGRTVYQMDTRAWTLMRSFGGPEWPRLMAGFLEQTASIRAELSRARDLVRVPVRLPSGEEVRLSPGGQNPLIKAVVEQFCPRFAPGGSILYLGDTETKFEYYEREILWHLGVEIHSSAKMPDVVVHHVRQNWLLLIEAVTSAGPVDAKRRKELKELFSGFPHGLVFVTAFANRAGLTRFMDQLAWETEVWIADEPDHIIHFNGERFLGPYPDTLPLHPAPAAPP